MRRRFEHEYPLCRPWLLRGFRRYGIHLWHHPHNLRCHLRTALVLIGVVRHRYCSRYSRHSAWIGPWRHWDIHRSITDCIEHDDHRKNTASLWPSRTPGAYLGTGTELPALRPQRPLLSASICLGGRSHRGRQRFLSWVHSAHRRRRSNFRQQRTVQCDIHHNAGEHRGSYQFCSSVTANIPAGRTAGKVYNTVYARANGNNPELMTRAGSALWNTLVALSFTNVTGSSTQTWANGSGGAWGWLFNHRSTIWPGSVASGGYGVGSDSAYGWSSWPQAT